MLENLSDIFNKLFHAGLLILIFLIPLVGNSSLFGYEQAKVISFLFLLSFSVTALFISLILKNQKLDIKITPIKLTISSFLLVLTFTSFTGIDVKASIIGRYPYFQGLIVYFCLFLFFLVISSTKINYKFIVTVLITSSLFISLEAIYQWVLINYFHQPLPTYAGRVLSTFGQPNFYSGFILLTLPLHKSLWSNNRVFNSILIILISINLIAIYISHSRAAIYLALIYLTIHSLLLLKSKLRKTIIILSILTICTSLFISFYKASGLFWVEYYQPKTANWLLKNSPEKRIFIWDAISDLIQKRPFTGYGLENIEPALAFYQKFHGDRPPQYYGVKNLLIDRSHSYLLDLVIFSGFLAAIIYITLILFAFKKNKNETLLIALIIYLLWSQFQNQSIAHLIFFFFLLGIIDRGASKVLT